MLASHYTAIRLLHVGCVALSGLLFAVRGVLRVKGSIVANIDVLRFMSFGIDTALLIAAILLASTLHEYPFVNSWLTVKALLLGLYVVLGSYALRRARTQTGRCVAFVAALATFGFIIGVAVTHQPAGWLTLMHSP